MNITFEKIDNVNGKIVAQVEEADYASKVDAELRKIGNTHNIPGFRKGHISLPQLRQRFGRQVKSDVLNRTVYDATVDYIKEQKLNIIGQPIAEEIKEINLGDKDYTFTYEVGLAPAIDIKLDSSVTLPYRAIKVTDDMVADEDKSLRERFGAQVPGEEVDEKALVKGTIMQLKEDGTVNDAENAIQVINGIVAPMYFKSKDEAAKFIGKKVNDKVVFNPYNSCEGNAAELASMLNIDKEQAPEVKGDFEMSISEIIVVKPAEHDQEFFDNVFGRDKVHSEEEYDKALRTVLANQFRSTTDYFNNLELKKYLTDTYGNLELPKEFLKKWLRLANEENIDDKTDMDKVYEEVLPDLTWQLIKEAIAAKFDVKIEEADVMARTKYIAQQQFRQYGIFNADEATIENAAKHILADRNYRQRIVEEVSDLKLFATVRANITLDVKEESLEDYRAYMAQQQAANADQTESAESAGQTAE